SEHLRAGAAMPGIVAGRPERNGNAMDVHGAGWRLRAARAQLGLTEEGLARELRRWAEVRREPRPDVTAETVAEWEAGLRRLALADLGLLLLALETPASDWAEVAGASGVDTWSLFRPSRPAANQGQRRREPARSLACLGEPAELDSERLSAALEATLKVDQ